MRISCKIGSHVLKVNMQGVCLPCTLVHKQRDEACRAHDIGGWEHSGEGEDGGVGIPTPQILVGSVFQVWVACRDNASRPFCRKIDGKRCMAAGHILYPCSEHSGTRHECTHFLLI